jgi:uncharacterized RDD family membrane protein YckC
MDVPGPALASLKARLAALAVDLATVLLLKFFVAVTLEAIAGEPFRDPPPLAPFLLLYVAYFALCMLLPERNTLGERLTGIAAVTLAGAPLSVPRSAARVVLVSFLWAGWMLLMDTSPPRALSVPAIVGLAIVTSLAFSWGVADVIVLLLTPTHRTLTDRALGIVMVNIPPLQPHRAPAGPMYSSTDAELGVARNRLSHENEKLAT